MKQHIVQFPTYLREGYDIGSSIDLSAIGNYDALLLVGMGGSAMTLTVMKGLVERSHVKSVPVHVVKEYTVPEWVHENTLMICASYSGNTEETVSAMQDALGKGAQMIALTSGGKLAEFCLAGGHTYATMPTGIEPRAALPYSFGIQLALFEKLGHISGCDADLASFESRAKTHTEKVLVQSKHIASAVADTFPFVYTTSGYEAVALRAEQQLQENSRMLAHHHILPEHNHNELLGRQEGSDVVSVIWLVDIDAYPRNKKRVELTKQVIKERGIDQFDIVLHGGNNLTKTISGIYMVDWLSYYLAEKRGVDPSGMKIIEDLKAQMKAFV